MGFLSKSKQATAKYGHDFFQEMRENKNELSQNRLVILSFRYSENAQRSRCVFCVLEGEQSICEAFKNVSR